MLPLILQTGLDNRPGTQSTKTERRQIKPSDFPWYSQVVPKRCTSSSVWPQVLSLCGKVLLNINDGHGSAEPRLSRKDHPETRASEGSLRTSTSVLLGCYGTGCWAQTRPKCTPTRYRGTTNTSNWGEAGNLVMLHVSLPQCLLDLRRHFQGTDSPRSQSQVRTSYGLTGTTLGKTLLHVPSLGWAAAKKLRMELARCA